MGRRRLYLYGKAELYVNIPGPLKEEASPGRSVTMSHVDPHRHPERASMWRPPNISSYPPPFRQPNHLPKPSNRDHPSNMTHILPIVDLQKLDPASLGEACRDRGLFLLINHGIPPALTTQIQDQAKSLFSLPFDSKQAQLTDHPISYFWGTPAVSQNVKNLNWVEGFHAPLVHLQDAGLKNIPMLESLRCVLEEYGQHMVRVARKLFEAMAANLALDPARTASYLSDTNGLMRVYRYPCCPETTAGEVFGMDAHTDSSVLSILNQDDVGGLQVLKDDLDDEWVDVRPLPAALVVNLGDMMQAMSNDEYKSVKHRVVVNEKKERISICFFGFPVQDSAIYSSKYKTFTYKDFQEKVQEDIKTTGFKVGLDHFKLKEIDSAIGS
ncbi:hypothetical protein ACLOJK_018439 [Asimina triloba]